MTAATSPAAPPSARLANSPASPRRHRLWAGDLLLYAALAALAFGAWKATRQGWFRAGDDVGYALGVAGGVAMLLLFSYPLRKHLRFMHGWGKVKWWFWAHMTLGAAGPLLILLHSTFHVGSLNAAVALYSMLVVALSGVVGRFLKLRADRGLHGERSNLDDLRARAGFVQDDARSRLHFAPQVEIRLLRFEQGELAGAPGWARTFRQVFFLPALQTATYVLCAMELRAALGRIGAQRGWNDEERAKRGRQARRLVWRYLGAVVRVAQFGAYARIFALWHVAHMPFVYILVVSATVHVVAVHAY